LRAGPSRVKQEKGSDLVFLKRMTGKAARLVSRESTSIMESRARLCASPLPSTSLESRKLQIRIAFILEKSSPKENSCCDPFNTILLFYLILKNLRNYRKIRLREGNAKFRHLKKIYQ
jgi:hypothetical protein